MSIFARLIAGRSIGRVLFVPIVTRATSPLLPTTAPLSVAWCGERCIRLEILDKSDYMYYVPTKRHTRPECMTWAGPILSRLITDHHHPERIRCPHRPHRRHKTTSPSSFPIRALGTWYLRLGTRRVGSHGWIPKSILPTSPLKERMFYGRIRGNGPSPRRPPAGVAVISCLVSQC